MIMEQYNNDIQNNNHGKKTAIQSKMYGNFIITIALPTLLLLLTLISAAPTYTVQATVANNETAATLAPGGTSIGSAGSGTNVTQYDCLPQNATTTNQSSAMNAGSANNTTVTFAPGGASIGANDTSTLNATAGNTAENTSTTFAPGGASLC